MAGNNEVNDPDGEQFSLEFPAKAKPRSAAQRDADNLQVDVDSAAVGHVTGDYGGDQIQVLEGLDAVRRNVAMYIGTNDSKGLHHLFTEVSDNAVDEALAGYCDRIDVVLHADGSMSVKDNGRGIPVDINAKYGVPGVELALTMLHAGSKFGGGAYKVSGGLHGVGVSCVNATSDWLTVTVTRESKVHKMGFERGIKTDSLKVVGKAKSTDHGTMVHWHADPQIFSDWQYDPEIIERRLRELAYLNKELTLTFTNMRDLVEQDPAELAEGATPTLPQPAYTVYHYPRGIIDYVEHLNETKDPVHKPIYFAGVKEDNSKDSVSKTFVEVAIQFNLGYYETLLSFANNINTPMGGTHASGFKTALTRVLNNYARKSGQLKEKDPNLSGEDVREGLSAVISIKLTDRPAFESQTKVKLTNAFVEGVVNSIVGEKLSEYLEETPAVAKRIIEKALTSQRARDAARKAADLVKRQSALNSNSLPGKLADCSDRNPKNCELFLVEGDSAGGPAKQGRDRRTQAILPLRGKIVNVGKARVDKVLENEEIRAMITALGTGISYGVPQDEEVDEESDLIATKSNKEESSYDLSKLRYAKIIIMTDADVDGDHIRTLLLTFFWTYMRPLIENGHVYIAQPPLYRIKSGKNDQWYAKNEEERDTILKRLKGKRDVMVTRFKGLGEMDAIDLAETTMEVDKRRLAQVRVDSDNLTAAIEMFDIFMSDKVEPRRDFIFAHAKEVTDVDWTG